MLLFTGSNLDKKTESVEVKKETESEQMVLVEPKQEFIEEDDTNSEHFDDCHNSSTEAPETEYDGRPVSGYYQHPIVERGNPCCFVFPLRKKKIKKSSLMKRLFFSGVPVPLLMCKTSLSESDAPEPGWMPPMASPGSSDHSSHFGNHEGTPDSQCRTCSQDLPCPTCTKKYKSRYALNR